MEARIEYFERMLADSPDNPTGLLALANEYNKIGRYEDEAAVLERYVAGVGGDDEGNAYLRLGEVLLRVGREEEARAAYETGIRQAEKFGHDGMTRGPAPGARRGSPRTANGVGKPAFRVRLGTRRCVIIEW